MQLQSPPAVSPSLLKSSEDMCFAPAYLFRWPERRHQKKCVLRITYCKKEGLYASMRRHPPPAARSDTVCWAYLLFDCALDSYCFDAGRPVEPKPPPPPVEPNPRVWPKPGRPSFFAPPCLAVEMAAARRPVHIRSQCTSCGVRCSMKRLVL